MTGLPDPYAPLLQKLFWCQVALLPFLLSGVIYNVKQSFGRYGHYHMLPGMVLMISTMFTRVSMVNGYKYAW